MDVKRNLESVEMIFPVGEKPKIVKLENGTYKVVQKVTKVNECFILIEAEMLSMHDEFMKYEPNTDRERELKALISEVIEKKVKNFYRPNCDPAFTSNGGICFEYGYKPAVGKSYYWWKNAAKEYKPERNSRLGTRLEYVAFLGVLIKKLIDEGMTVEQAWNSVCNDSVELGHCWNSKNAQKEYETTGSRQYCGFYDLVNVNKVLSNDEDDGTYWRAGATCHDYCSKSSISYLYNSTYPGHIYFNQVGWIVLEF